MNWEMLTVIGAFIAMIGAIWKIARDFRDDLQKTTDLLFKRFDQHKEAVDKKIFMINDSSDKKYAQQSICDITRATFTKAVDDINRKLDLLLEERRHS